ncbi:MAG: GTP cyclohydrolase I FolE [Chloroflexota bacterium]|nr:GTP cyclohydrolase I FolE [Chloroflexota bacterium]
MAGHPFDVAIRQLLSELGEDPGRDGLRRTPERVRTMWSELTDGYRVDADALLNAAVFHVDYDEMVVVRDIEFHSLCEHHLLPFWGMAHVGYLPRSRVIGLSKIPRVVDLFARRLQLQERMTNEIARFLMERLEPRGVACVVEAAHMCTIMRGVKKEEARMVTSAMLGTFRRDLRTRTEFLSLVARHLSA